MNQRFYEFNKVVLDLNHVVSAFIEGNLGSSLLATPASCSVKVMLSYGHKVVLHNGSKEECEECLDRLKRKLTERSKK